MCWKAVQSPFYLQWCDEFRTRSYHHCRIICMFSNLWSGLTRFLMWLEILTAFLITDNIWCHEKGTLPFFLISAVFYLNYVLSFAVNIAAKLSFLTPLLLTNIWCQEKGTRVILNPLPHLTHMSIKMSVCETAQTHKRVKKLV